MKKLKEKKIEILSITEEIVKLSEKIENMLERMVSKKEDLEDRMKESLIKNKESVLSSKEKIKQKTSEFNSEISWLIVSSEDKTKNELDRFVINNKKQKLKISVYVFEKRLLKNLKFLKDLKVNLEELDRLIG